MTLIRSAMCIAILSVAGHADAASTAVLPLDPGVYVVSSYSPCAEAPLAGVEEYDGKSLAGPHDSQCTTTIEGRHGNRYSVTTTCRAFGDGTAQSPTPWSQTIEVRSRTGFTAITGDRSVDYALCPGFH